MSLTRVKNITTNLGISQANPDAEIHVSTVRPHLDIEDTASGARAKIGSGYTNTYLATTHGSGEIIFKNNVGGSDFPHSSGTTLMTIGASGYITNPLQPAFNATRTSGQTISGTVTLVFNSVRSNASNSYNSSNGYFTAPISGQYLFTFKSLFYAFDTSEYLDLYSYVNSTIRNRYEQTGNGGGHTQINYAEIVYLNSNDTFRLVCSDRNTGSYAMYANENHFSGRLLG